MSVPLAGIKKIMNPITGKLISVHGKTAKYLLNNKSSLKLPSKFVKSLIKFQHGGTNDDEDVCGICHEPMTADQQIWDHQCETATREAPCVYHRFHTLCIHHFCQVLTNDRADTDVLHGRQKFNCPTCRKPFDCPVLPSEIQPIQVSRQPSVQITNVPRPTRTAAELLTIYRRLSNEQRQAEDITITNRRLFLEQARRQRHQRYQEEQTTLQDLLLPQYHPPPLPPQIATSHEMAEDQRAWEESNSVINIKSTQNIFILRISYNGDFVAYAQYNRISKQWILRNDDNHSTIEFIQNTWTNDSRIVIDCPNSSSLVICREPTHLNDGFKKFAIPRHTAYVSGMLDIFADISNNARALRISDYEKNTYIMGLDLAIVLLQ